MITIYHNGECSKSKGALELLQEKGIEHEVRYYLVDPLSEEELKELLRKLKLPAADLIRKSEPVYKEQYEGKELSEEQWINIIAMHPVLMERPVVVNGEKAVIARPAERVFEVL